MVLAHDLDDWHAHGALTPQEIWAQCRTGAFDELTTGYAAGYDAGDYDDDSGF